MTSPNDPWSNPYGQAGQPGEPGQQQYTQPTYGPPPDQQGYGPGGPGGGQPGYGSQYAGGPGPGYGQPQYGQPQYGPQQGQFGPPQFGGPPYGTRPAPTGSSGTLLTAAIVQIIQSAVWIIIGVVLIVAANAVDSILTDAGINDSDVHNAVVAIGLISIAVAVAMIVLGAFALRRSNGCRIASIVMQIIFAVIWLLLTISAINDGSNPGFGVAFLVSSVLVTVLMFTSSAKAATGAGAR